MRTICLFFCAFAIFSCNSREKKADESGMISDSVKISEKDDSATKVDAESEKSLQANVSVKRSSDQLENFAAITNYQPEKSSKELSIQSFVSRLDRPDSTFKDTDSSCSVGQLHFWNLSTQQCRIFALGDEYSKANNLNASCRVYGIQLMDNAESSSYKGFLGIRLGEDASEVENKLKGFVKEHPSFAYQKQKDESALEKLLMRKQKSVYVLTDGKKYYHFAIGKKQKLNYILIASMNVHEAC